MEKVAQGGAGVIIPGSIQEAFGCGTWGRGLRVIMVVLE